MRMEFGRCRKVGCSSYENKESCSWCGASRYIEKHGEACINILQAETVGGAEKLELQAMEMSSQILGLNIQTHSQVLEILQGHTTSRNGGRRQRSCRFKSCRWEVRFLAPNIQAHSQVWEILHWYTTSRNGGRRQKSWSSGHGDEQSDSGADIQTHSQVWEILHWHTISRNGGRSRKAGGSSHGDEELDSWCWTSTHTYKYWKSCKEYYKQKQWEEAEKLQVQVMEMSSWILVLNIHTHSQAWDILHQHTTSKNGGRRQRSWRFKSWRWVVRFLVLNIQTTV